MFDETFIFLDVSSWRNSVLYVTELEGHNDLILSSDMQGTTLVTARYAKPDMMLDLFCVF